MTSYVKVYEHFPFNAQTYGTEGVFLCSYRATRGSSRRGMPMYCFVHWMSALLRDRITQCTLGWRRASYGRGSARDGAHVGSSTGVHGRHQRTLTGECVRQLGTFSSPGTWKTTTGSSLKTRAQCSAPCMCRCADKSSSGEINIYAFT